MLKAILGSCLILATKYGHKKIVKVILSTEMDIVNHQCREVSITVHKISHSNYDRTCTTAIATDPSNELYSYGE